MNEENFNDIRPYNDSEIGAAIQRIITDETFSRIMSTLFTNIPYQTIQSVMLSCQSVDDIQKIIMRPAIREIIKQTMTEFTYSGSENIDTTRGHLFISNHRDITLDAFLLLYTLFETTQTTGYITLGNNLLHPQLAVDIMLSNRGVRVIRKDDVSARELLANSIHLSQYLRELIAENNSVWIAQRNGRTKDGNDITEQGVLKMLALSGGDDFVENFGQLDLKPVAISYQYEPCGILKAIELTHKANGEVYHKAENEDIISILTGIRQPKGRVNITICPTITKQVLTILNGENKAEKFQSLTHEIDRLINSNYKLFDTNYIAYDILNNTDKYAHNYSKEDKANFEQYLAMADTKFAAANIDVKTAHKILLGIYANPIKE